MPNHTTKQVDIIGHHISHSKSPAMMNAAFAEKELDYRFGSIDVAPEDFPAVMAGLAREDYAGLTITLPYKIEVIPYLDGLDPLAKLIGAVNAVKVEEGKLIGHNTDGAGFVQALEDFDVDVSDSTYFVIGSGGVARAILVTLASKHPKKIYVESRNFDHVKKLCAYINDEVFPCCVAIPHEADFKPYLDQCSVVVNASYVGMPPHDGQAPIDTSLLNKNQLVVDAVYNPLKTKLLEDAQALGCRFFNGQYQLLHQGEIAFQLWTGVEAPRSIMHKAVFGD